MRRPRFFSHLHVISSLDRHKDRIELRVPAGALRSFSSSSRGGAFWPGERLSESGWSDEDGASHSPSARPETLLLCCHGNSSSHHRQHGPIMHTHTHSHTHTGSIMRYSKCAASSQTSAHIQIKAKHLSGLLKPLKC